MNCVYKSPDGECMHDAKDVEDCQFLTPEDCSKGCDPQEAQEHDEQEQA